MAALSMLVLLALIDAATGLSMKQSIYFNSMMSWTDAQTVCRNNYVDLFAINTQLESWIFQMQTSNFKSDKSWIGLSKTASETQFTQWSDGSIMHFVNWRNESPSYLETEDCVFTVNDKWDVESCSTLLNFFCYEWVPELIVVQEMMTWEDALMYCRTHYKDLVSVATNIDFLRVDNLSPDILTLTFWTGLRFMDGSWFWVNQDRNLPTMPPCPASPFRCGAIDIKNGVWENRDCREKMNFICYVW